MTDQVRSLQDQLEKERRRCPNCALDIAHPMIERCPRCFAQLPRIDFSCQGCVHLLTCPAQHEYELKGSKEGKNL